MELQKHEVICSKCDGLGVFHSDNSPDSSFICNKCGGVGKVDWVTNAMVQKDPSYFNASKIFETNPCSDISFYHEGIESLKITKDGFYIKGKKVADDNKIYDAFVDFLKDAGTY